MKHNLFLLLSLLLTLLLTPLLPGAAAADLPVVYSGPASVHRIDAHAQFQPWMAAELSMVDGGVAVRSTAGSGSGGGAALVNLQAAPGASCTLTFRARGEVRLNVMLNAAGFPNGRLDLLTATRLDDSWKLYELPFNAPAGGDKFLAVFFAWQESGDFELSDVEVRARGDAPGIVIMDEHFYWGEFIDGIRSTHLPAGWNGNGGEGGGLTGGKEGMPPHALEIKPGGGFRSDYRRLPVGRALKIALTARMDSGSLKGARAFLHFADRNRELLQVLPVPLPSPSGPEWSTAFHQLAVEEIPPAARYYAIVLENSGDKPILFDAVKVEAAAALGTSLKLRDQAFGNWHFRGEVVTVKPAGEIPEGLESLTGTVFDSTGHPAARITVNGGELAALGWSWQPATPGFYEIAFTCRIDGAEYGVVEDYVETHWQKNQAALFHQERLPVIVAATERGALQAPWLGFSVDSTRRGRDTGRSLQELELARLMGVGFIRPHGATWEQLEPVRGQLDFYTDPLIDAALASGLDVVYNIYGTARWASSRADDGRALLGWVPAWSTYAPADTADYANFIAALVRHYQDRINRYELWNEPHLPGYSVFWSDTPERFVEMFRAGSAAVRREQPEAEIWIGGMGQRYLPFYEKIMALGIGDAFDVMPFHGRNYHADSFRAVDRANGQSEKIYSSSEWHSILVQYQAMKPNQDSTDREIAKLMLLDLMRQLQQGVREITAFCTVGYGRVSSLAFRHEMGDGMPQAAGFFEPTPYLVPRFPSLILQNFAATFPESVLYRNQYRSGELKAALFDSAGRPVLIVWHDGEVPLPLPLEMLAPDTVVTDWEGKTVENGLILPETFYYLTGSAALDKLEAADDVLSVDRRSLPLAGPAGPLSKGDLVSADGEFLAESSVWIDIASRHGDPGEKRARYCLTIAGDTVQLVVETAELQHCQEHTGIDMWRGDGLQFAFDSEGKGYADVRIEFQAALTPEGPRIYKEYAPMPGGDLPERYTAPGQNAFHALCRVEEMPEGKRYLLRIPFSELYPMAPAGDRPLRFAILVNECANGQRTGYLHWGDGIGGDKNPTLYGTLQ